MKKLILLVLFILIYPSVIYAVTEEASTSSKSSSGYDPKCWNTHMIDQMAVCSKAHNSCANSCTKKDLKANALCLTECNNVLKACYNKASADYKICIEAEKQAKKQQGIQLESKVTQTPSEKPATQNKPSEVVNPFNFFAFNPLEIWRNIQGILDIEQGLPSLLQSSQFLTESAEVPVEIPRPSIAFDPEGKPWDFLPGFIPHESIKPNSTITATKPTTFQTGSAVIQLRPNNNQEGSMEMGTHPFLQSGEAEIIVEPQNGQQFELQTPNAEIFVIGTKFLVIYDTKKNQTLVAVYEGKVEVKTRDGRTTMVSPDGDKPGVVVVAQKLSIIKLALVGLVLVVISGGVAFFLKRKFFQQATNKRKRN